ncbi:MAG: outer membrane protein assembly factor BamC, partial [Gammaproteobacteria bacterium]|nr:outer membrane protein assembly factor BamC [Gammaproteobacteria bacterium]
QGGNIEKTSSSSDKQASISRSSGVATLSETGGKVSLKVPDGYDQAWIRTSSVLTNAGFALDGENKSKGLYAARWEGGGDKEKGFFKRLIKFDNKLLKVGAEQLIHVSQSDGGSRLRVLDKNGKSIDVAVARKILERLKTEYNR